MTVPLDDASVLPHDPHALVYTERPEHTWRRRCLLGDGRRVRAGGRLPDVGRSQLL